MQQSISLHTFRSAFQQMRPDNFSYSGLEILFNYLEALEDDMGEKLEFDVIALCCDYSEDTYSSLAENYSIDLSACEDEEECMETVKDYLQDNGAYVGETSNSLIYNVNF